MLKSLMLNRDDAIALAKEGTGAWNDWARRNPGASVDFSGATFPEISFAGFQFPGEADFTGAKFSSVVNFTLAKFLGEADFREATFSSESHFVRATFSSLANFSGVAFSKGANFASSMFSSGAYFHGSEFSHLANFEGVTFLDDVHFSGGSFSFEVYFDKSSFRGVVDFSDQKFNGPTFFREVTFPQVPLFHGASIHQGTKFENIDDAFTDFQSDGAEQCYRTLKLAMGQQQARTEEAAFAALELKARRYRLIQEANKRPTKERSIWQRFLSWPKRCGNWIWEKLSAVAQLSLCLLNKLGLRRFLLRAEICSYCLWENLSDSGRSFARPFALYLVFVCAFAASYVMLPICFQTCEMPNSPYVLNWWRGIFYSFLKQLPFAAAFRGSSDRIGALEEYLFCLNGENLPPVWVDALNIAQSIFALALIFLMGLGIRHKFRLR